LSNKTKENDERVQALVEIIRLQSTTISEGSNNQRQMTEERNSATKRMVEMEKVIVTLKQSVKEKKQFQKHLEVISELNDGNVVVARGNNTAVRPKTYLSIPRPNQNNPSSTAARKSLRVTNHL
jgi:5,10-methylenetetrahydrofolate reductase